VSGPDGQVPRPEARAYEVEGDVAGARPSPGRAGVAALRSGPVTGGRPPAGLRRLKLVAFVLLGLMLAADLVSKDLLMESLVLREGRNGERDIDLIPGFFALQGTWNPGVTFGMARGYTFEILVLTGAATLALLTWLVATRRASRLLHIGLGLIISGALGNLYDRIRWSEVRDFFLIYLGALEKPDWTWPNFNVADASIVVGVGLVIWDALFGLHPTAPKRVLPAAGVQLP